MDVVMIFKYGKRFCFAPLFNYQRSLQVCLQILPLSNCCIIAWKRCDVCVLINNKIQIVINSFERYTCLQIVVASATFTCNCGALSESKSGPLNIFDSYRLWDTWAPHLSAMLIQHSYQTYKTTNMLRNKTPETITAEY